MKSNRNTNRKLFVYKDTFSTNKKVIHYNTHAVYPLTKNNCLPTIKTKRGHTNNNLTKLNT